MILQSRLLAAIPGLRHGFSTRLGGVSSGPFATLNLDARVGDDPARVRENLVRFGALAGFPAGTPVFQANQVHGAAVLDAANIGTPADRPDGDALFSTRAGVAVGVRTADCVPLLIAALNAGRPIAVAAVHAGWRGATDGVVTQALAALAAIAPITEQRFAIGPAIGPDAFEVGDEVIEAARKALGEEPPMYRAANGKPHLDLPGFVERQLLAAGARPDHIDRTGGCTHDVPALYFSHRRDRGLTGRHLAAIARL